MMMLKKNQKGSLKMPKFDVIIMNPPYSKNLHLDILENVIPCADKVINISPIFWLIDKFVKFKTKVAYHRYEETSCGQVITIHLGQMKFCKHFGITGYINDNLAEPNSEWEIILNTIKEYNE